MRSGRNSFRFLEFDQTDYKNHDTGEDRKPGESIGVSVLAGSFAKHSRSLALAITSLTCDTDSRIPAIPSAHLAASSSIFICSVGLLLSIKNHAKDKECNAKNQTLAFDDLETKE
jgi:hypothetical protein